MTASDKGRRMCECATVSCELHKRQIEIQHHEDSNERSSSGSLPACHPRWRREIQLAGNVSGTQHGCQCASRRQLNKPDEGTDEQRLLHKARNYDPGRLSRHGAVGPGVEAGAGELAPPPSGRLGCGLALAHCEPIGTQGRLDADLSGGQANEPTGTSGKCGSSAAGGMGDLGGVGVGVGGSGSGNGNDDDDAIAVSSFESEARRTQQPGTILVGAREEDHRYQNKLANWRHKTATLMTILSGDAGAELATGAERINEHASMLAIDSFNGEKARDKGIKTNISNARLGNIEIDQEQSGAELGTSKGEQQKQKQAQYHMRATAPVRSSHARPPQAIKMEQKCRWAGAAQTPTAVHHASSSSVLSSGAAVGCQRTGAQVTDEIQTTIKQQQLSMSTEKNPSKNPNFIDQNNLQANDLKLISGEPPADTKNRQLLIEQPSSGKTNLATRMAPKTRLAQAGAEQRQQQQVIGQKSNNSNKDLHQNQNQQQQQQQRQPLKASTNVMESKNINDNLTSTANNRRSKAGQLDFKLATPNSINSTNLCATSELKVRQPTTTTITPTPLPTATASLATTSSFVTTTMTYANTVKSNGARGKFTETAHTMGTAELTKVVHHHCAVWCWRATFVFHQACRQALVESRCPGGGGGGERQL